MSIYQDNAMSSPDMSDVLICFDRNVIHGAHVAAQSILRSSPGGIAFHFFIKDIRNFEIDMLEKSLQLTNRKYSICVYEIDDRDFRSFKPLVGNIFAYSRLLASQKIMSRKILYIDTDVIANVDAADIIRTALDGYALACSGVGQVKSSLDKELFLSLGMENDDTVFNSGVLLFDLDKWRKLKIQERCFEFGNLYSDQLRSADQTILNGVFRGNIKILSENWNIACYPSTRYCDCTGHGIYHFLGTPKPWDIGGEKLHNFHSAWMSESAKTALPFKRNNLSFFSSMKRSLRLSRSYYKLIKGKIKNEAHIK